MMPKDIFIGEVFANDEVRKDHFLMKIYLPPAFGGALPGQFVMLRIAGLADPFLSRPLSIYSFTAEKHACVCEILYRVVGKGTKILAGLIEGSQLEVHGPLGTGYAMPDGAKNIIFIAGGIGVAPLSLLAEHLCRNRCRSGGEMTFYLGAKTQEQLVGVEKIQTLCYGVHLCTDDGTAGKKAIVTDLLRQDLGNYRPEETMIYACGPKSMLRSLGTLLDNRYRCQVSLEERMACGVGACVGCVVAVKDERGDTAYKRVCADGPVFELHQIVWD